MGDFPILAFLWLMSSSHERTAVYFGQSAFMSGLPFYYNNAVENFIGQIYLPLESGAG
jgi:hypothetical protein